MPKADTGPLSGALWPMVISLSVTPGPYFLSCASAIVAIIKADVSPAASSAIVVARILPSAISTGLSTGRYARS